MLREISFNILIERFLNFLVDILVLVYLPLKPKSDLTYIVRSTSLGDFTVSLPFIASVIKERPNVQLLIISRFGNVGSIILPHWGDRITFIDSSSFGFSSPRKLRLKNIKSKSASEILFAAQSGISPVLKLKYLLAVRVTLGLDAPVKGLLTISKLKTRSECEANPNLMSINVGLAPFVACGITPRASRSDCQALLAITDEENREVDRTLNHLGIKSTNTPLVAFYVHAKDERKRWPIDRFITVARTIIKEYNQNIILIGGPGDRDASEAFAKKLPPDRVTVVAGLLSVRGTFALLSNCNLFVGNDGSPTHMAAIQGCQCVTIYCNWEVSGFWEPIAAPASISLRPVWNTERDKENFGIENIPVEGVMNAVRYFLNGTVSVPMHRVQYYDSGLCVSERLISEKILTG
jgi:ADP-heptose:LPS heptosyltransferase